MRENYFAKNRGKMFKNGLKFTVNLIKPTVNLIDHKIVLYGITFITILISLPL